MTNFTLWPSMAAWLPRIFLFQPGFGILLSLCPPLACFGSILWWSPVLLFKPLAPDCFNWLYTYAVNGDGLGISGSLIVMAFHLQIEDSQRASNPGKKAPGSCLRTGLKNGAMPDRPDQLRSHRQNPQAGWSQGNDARLPISRVQSGTARAASPMAGGVSGF